jgi:hypothetical protein
VSTPIRYGLADEHLGRITPQADGHLVMWSDYAALAAEYVEVKDLHLKCRVDIGNLKAENERLKEAWVDKRMQEDRDFLLSDNAALRAEVERLRAASFVTAVPAEHYERVVAAGDAMLGTMLWAAAKNPEGPATKRIEAWIAAKEGDAK